MHPLKTIRRFLWLTTLVAVITLASCAGDLSPFKGPGALWIYERGGSHCVQVATLTYKTDRAVSYTQENGTPGHNIAPVDYQAGEHCPTAMR